MKRLYPTVKELALYKEMAKEYKISGLSIAIMNKEDLEKRLMNDAREATKLKRKKSFICQTEQ